MPVKLLISHKSTFMFFYECCKSLEEAAFSNAGRGTLHKLRFHDQCSEE